MASPEAVHDGFRVDALQHWLGGLVERCPRLLKRAGDWESRCLRAQLDAVPVERPIFIAGLARSGTTVLLELLAGHPHTATHRYRDFPLLHLPWAWNRFLELAPRRTAPPVERAHRDGIRVTPESPEAFEEVLWMAFFPRLHDPQRSAVLDAGTRAPAFEGFYRDHLRKILLLRAGRRYLSKGNYNLTRLDYLLRLFPDARLVVPVRDPVWHIASLDKQHRLFLRAQAGNPRALAYLRRAGHFEFGADRRPINAGDTDEIRRILALWDRGEAVEGWARYWAHVHGFLAGWLAARPRLRSAVHLVAYDALCADPSGTLAGVLEHCGLPRDDGLLEAAARRIRPPGYYQPRFSRRERTLIERHAGPVAARLGAGRGCTAAG